MPVDIKDVKINNRVMDEVVDFGVDSASDIIGLRAWNLVFVKKLNDAIRSDMSDGVSSVDEKSHAQAVMDFNEVMLSTFLPLESDGDCFLRYSPFGIMYRKWVTDDGSSEDFVKDIDGKLGLLDMFVARGDMSTSRILSDFSVVVEKYFDELFDIFVDSAINMKDYNRYVYMPGLLNVENVFYKRVAEVIFDDRFVRSSYKETFPFMKSMCDEKLISE